MPRVRYDEPARTVGKHVHFADKDTVLEPRPPTKRPRWPDPEPRPRSHRGSSSNEKWSTQAQAGSRGSSSGRDKPKQSIGLSSLKHNQESSGRSSHKPRESSTNSHIPLVTQPLGHEPYFGRPKQRHEKRGFEWKAYEITIRSVGRY